MNIKLDGFVKQNDIIKITLRLLGVYFKFCINYLKSESTLNHPLITNLEKVVLK